VAKTKKRAAVRAQTSGWRAFGKGAVRAGIRGIIHRKNEYHPRRCPVHEVHVNPKAQDLTTLIVTTKHVRRPIIHGPGCFFCCFFVFFLPAIQGAMGMGRQPGEHQNPTRPGPARHAGMVSRPPYTAPAPDPIAGKGVGHPRSATFLSVADDASWRFFSKAGPAAGDCGINQGVVAMSSRPKRNQNNGRGPRPRGRRNTQPTFGDWGPFGRKLIHRLEGLDVICRSHLFMPTEALRIGNDSSPAAMSAQIILVMTPAECLRRPSGKRRQVVHHRAARMEAGRTGAGHD